MSRPTDHAPARAAESPWLAFGLMGVTGALLGATATYLWLLPRLAPTGADATTPAALVQPATGLPPPELTAGMVPAEADRALGNFYYDRQDWLQAARSYESAIKGGADDPDVRTDLGNAYRFSNRPNDALAQYRRAQELNPNHEFSLFNQGGLFLEDLKDRDQAVAVWTEYLRRFPQGQNVLAAQKLLAQTGERPAGTATAVTKETERADIERLLRRVAPTPASGKP